MTEVPVKKKVSVVFKYEGWEYLHIKTYGDVLPKWVREIGQQFARNILL